MRRKRRSDRAAGVADRDNRSPPRTRARAPVERFADSSRSTISRNVSSPWPTTTASTAGSSRHSRRNSDGCQPPQTTGHAGRARFDRARDGERVADRRAGQHGDADAQRASAASTTRRTGSRSSRPSMITTSTCVAIERRGERHQRQRHRVEHRARVVEDDARSRRVMPDASARGGVVVSNAGASRAPTVPTGAAAGAMTAARRGSTQAAPATDAAARRATARSESRASASRATCRRAELVVHDAVQHAIELGLVGRAIHHREVARVEPVLLLPELCAHALVETRARQRIRHRHADVVGLELARRAAASPRCRPTSRRDSRTAGRSRPRCPRPSAAGWRLANLLDAHALLHRVENALRARLGAHPHHAAAGGAPARARLARSPDRRASGSGTAAAGVAARDQARQTLRPIPAAARTRRRRSTI